MTDLIKNCTAVILAGGENRRMPVLKAFIEVKGEKIIERNIKKLGDLFSKIFIMTNDPSRYIYLGAPMFGDIYDMRGPMTGIYTALINSTDRWIFVSACDMPFINIDLVRYMASKRKGHDAVIPLKEEEEEPLFAFYSKSLLSSMNSSLLRGDRGLKDFLNGKRVQYISSEEIKAVDPRAESFINLNTPEDIVNYLDKSDILRFNKKIERRH